MKLLNPQVRQPLCLVKVVLKTELVRLVSACYLTTLEITWRRMAGRPMKETLVA